MIVVVFVGEVEASHLGEKIRLCELFGAGGTGGLY